MAAGGKSIREAERNDLVAAAKQEVALELQKKALLHPCYSEEAHHHFARMHLAVAPRCNIQCNYCNRRYDCASESRPGVTSELLTPREALTKVGIVLGAIPQLTVVGIAGPGDPLANPEETFETFGLISKAYPDLQLCLSTNGLLLPEYLDAITEAGVEHVTVTINMVDPEVGKDIYGWIRYRGRLYVGEKAAAILLEQQLKGLAGLAARGVACKVNIVMIPGVNDHHIPEVARTVKETGAFIVNIMPLITTSGTKFEGRRGPTPAELKAVQDACANYVTQMRHCRQCRADAIGLLGHDRAAEFTKARWFGQERKASLPDRERTSSELAERKIERGGAHFVPDEVDWPLLSGVLVAVASTDDGLVNQHFGHAKDFLIYQVEPDGSKLVGRRSVERYCCGSEECLDGEERLQRVVTMLKDCRAVLCSRIGPEPSRVLAEAGIDAVMTYGYIDEAIRAYVQRLGKEAISDQQRIQIRRTAES